MGRQAALLLTAPPCILCGGRERRRLDEETRIVRAAAPRFLVRCLRCGLVSVHPLPRSDELRSLYLDDAVMQQYREAHGRAYVMGDLEPEPHLGRRLEVLEGYLGGPGRILDVGAGSGVFLALARSRGWDVAGIELSRPAVQAARERFGIELVHGPMEENNFPNAAFDAVHISHVLEHFLDPLQALGEIRRVLRPRGVLVVEAPNEFDDFFGNTRSLLGRPRQPYEVPSPHTYFFTPWTLRGLLARAGFRTVRLETRRRNPDTSSRLPLGGWVKRAIYALEEILRRGPLIEVFAVPAHGDHGRADNHA